MLQSDSQSYLNFKATLFLKVWLGLGSYVRITKIK